tara:strand:- start:9 stop:164 length:156 start_codon:yes stop_codon:yes gene_type:complete
VLKEMVMESSNVRSFAKSYFEYLFKLLNQIDMDAIAFRPLVDELVALPGPG